MTPDEYHSDTSRISKSGLDKINKSPLHYYQHYLAPDRDTQEETKKSLIIGSATHCGTFEADEFKKRYAIAPEIDRRSKEGKSEWAAFEILNRNKILLPLQYYEVCSRVADAVHKHPTARELISEGVCEQRTDFVEPISGAACKIKPDFFNTKIKYIVDLKTTDDASENGFGRSAFKYRYHVQAPFYTDGLRISGEEVEGFVFIAVEKSPPYAVGIYFTGKEEMQLGRDKYIKDCMLYQECLKNNAWPGYSELVTALKLPAWAYKN